MLTKNWSFKITPVRIFLFVLTLFAGVLAVFRLFTGLGVTTNLNDQWPWGLWIGVDLTAVALAGAGYSIAVLTHVLHIKRFSSVTRRALLISFVGYIFVLLTLILEIGRWDNFWRPLVSWGYHSPMFEVFMCISVYFLMQFIEFGEIVTEKIGKVAHKWIVKIMPVVVIIAALLPFGHQASLGAVYLIFPDKLHTLWYTSMLPWFFLISSFFVGPAVVALETIFSSKLRKEDVDLDVLKGLSKISGFIMIVYFILKVADLAVRGALSLAFAGTLEGNMFLLEMLVGVLIPVMICFSPWINKKNGILTFAGFTAFGIVINRVNVVFVGMYNALGSGYVPSWIEWGISIGLLAAVILVYTYIVENFAIFSTVQKPVANEDKDYNVLVQKQKASFQVSK